ncbi:TPA: restriction endonuclease subunit S [Photobacterium damselae]
MTVESLITQHIDTWTSAVKTKSTTGRGSSKKLELYGVKKLRELILELAVRGKLVPQDPTDEPASVLIEKIKIKKEQLLKEGTLKKLKKAKVHEAVLSGENKPTGWEAIDFGDITFNLDAKRDPLSVSERKGRQGDYDYYGASGVIDYIDDYLFDKPLLLIGEDGANLVNRSTPIAFMARGKYWVNNHAHVIDGISEDFLIYLGLYINSISLIPYITGMAQPKMNQAKMNSILVLLPPENEQRRIIAKVDELMALCDQLEQQTEASIEAHQLLVSTLLNTLTNSADADELMENWARISNHFDTLFTTEESIDQLKQTILQLAVMGKLVPQDPSDELQPKDLVTVVKKQRTISSLAKNTGKVDLNTFEFFAEKLALPNNWTVHPLAEIVLAVVDCPHSTPRWTDSGEICIRTTQMAPFSLDLSTSRYVSSDTYQKRIERLKPEGDDVLYSREGGILGVACRVPSGVELCLGQRMIVIRPSRLIISRFLELVLNSPLVNEIALHNTTGGAAPRVNVNVIKGYPIPLPPLAEQNRVITKVEKLIDLCDLLKARLKESQATQLQLTDAIVEQAV